MDDVQKVTVKLCPEPSNPVDSQTIAFVVCLDNKEHRIGYVVQEVLDDLHEEISSGDVVSVQFKWVKYRLNWYYTGPGYYYWCGRTDLTYRNRMKYLSTCYTCIHCKHSHPQSENIVT